MNIIVTEDNNPLITEDNQTLLLERQQDILLYLQTPDGKLLLQAALIQQ